MVRESGEGGGGVRERGGVGERGRVGGGRRRDEGKREGWRKEGEG